VSGGTTSPRGDQAQRAPRASLLARLRYRFDAALSRGPSVVIGYLGLVTLVVIVITALVLTIFGLTGINGGESLSFPEAFWQSLLRVVDSGSFAGDGTWITRIVALTVTLIGIFLAGSLIGLIASSVDQRIEELRKGRSAVLESDHTLILGWSARVPAVVSELVIANASRKRAAVVTLANEDKSVMEEALRDKIADFNTTKLVCRSGDPADPKTLELVNVAGARSIVIIGTEDAATIKTLLAIRTLGIGEGDAHIVAEMSDNDIATSARALFGKRLVVVNSDNVVAELTAQACRQRGLSAVFRELLDFDGDEIYFAKFPELVGRTYGEALMSFERCSVMGRLGRNGVELNPSPDTVLEAGDELIGVAGDDSEFVYTGSGVQIRQLPAGEFIAPTATRRIIIAGWSDLGPRVVAELDEFLGAETTLELMLDPDRVDVEEVRRSIAVSNVSVEISHLRGGPERVAAQAARRAFNEVIVLGYRDGMSADDADARTLMTLLAFRQVRQVEEVGPVRMVAELLDQRNAKLAAATGADDFIVSDELTSLMLAQLSERLELIQVFDDLFDRDGCTIELRPVREFGAVGAVQFGEVVRAASSDGHSAIGYRIGSTGEVVVNPAKAASITFSDADEILVLSGVARTASPVGSATAE
jgi:ion channel POLLUX/CASTOR